MSRGPLRPLVVLSANKGANTGRAGGVIPRIQRYFEASGVDVVTVVGRGPQEATELLRSALHSLHSDTEAGLPRSVAVVVAGGDGAVHTAVQVVAGTSIPLGVIPMGSGNDIARELGLRRSTPRAAVTAIVEALEAPWQPSRPRHGFDTATMLPGHTSQGRIRPWDAVEVTDASGRTTWFLGIMSAGIDAAVNQRTNEMSWPPGGTRYLRALVECAGDLRPYGYRITLDGQEQPCSGLLLAVANTRFFGGGMQVNPGARWDDGLMEVVVVDPIPLATLARVFPRIYRGTHIHHPAVHVLRAQEVHIENDPGFGRPAPLVMADGEPLGELPLTARIRPGAVHLVTRTVGG